MNRTEHDKHGCWTSEDSFLGPLKGGDVKVTVRKDELFNEGDVLAIVNGREMRSPYYATVDEINPDALSGSIKDGDWLIKVRDINPAITIYPAPPLEVIGVEEPPISGNELYRRIRKGMNLPGVTFKNIVEAVDLLCPNRSSKKDRQGNRKEDERCI